MHTRIVRHGTELNDPPSCFFEFFPTDLALSASRFQAGSVVPECFAPMVPGRAPRTGAALVVRGLFRLVGVGFVGATLNDVRLAPFALSLAIAWPDCWDGRADRTDRITGEGFGALGTDARFGADALGLGAATFAAASDGGRALGALFWDLRPNNSQR